MRARTFRVILDALHGDCCLLSAQCVSPGTPGLLCTCCFSSHDGVLNECCSSTGLWICFVCLYSAFGLFVILLRPSAPATTSSPIHTVMISIRSFLSFQLHRTLVDRSRTPCSSFNAVNACSCSCSIWRLLGEDAMGLSSPSTRARQCYAPTSSRGGGIRHVRLLGPHRLSTPSDF